MIDKYPALIVRCIDATDVIAAVTFAREQGMAVAVRSGGHSLSGHSTTDGGMLIDLSPMKAINIDRIRRIARIEPGLTWGEVARAAHAYGLTLTSGDMASVGESSCVHAAHDESRILVNHAVPDLAGVIIVPIEPANQ